MWYNVYKLIYYKISMEWNMLKTLWGGHDPSLSFGWPDMTTRLDLINYKFHFVLLSCRPVASIRDGVCEDGSSAWRLSCRRMSSSWSGSGREPRFGEQVRGHWDQTDCKITFHILCMDGDSFSTLSLETCDSLRCLSWPQHHSSPRLCRRRTRGSWRTRLSCLWSSFSRSGLRQSRLGFR